MTESGPRPRRDYCKGVRTTYAAIIRSLASHTPLALLLAALPAAYIVLFTAIYYIQNPGAPLSGAATSYSVALALLWLLATISTWKVAPNLLSVAIYLMRAIADWAAISFLILVSYGFSVLPITYTSILFVTLAPLVLLLHLAADILRSVREHLYRTLEAPSPPPEPATSPSEIVIQK